MPKVDVHALLERVGRRRRLRPAVVVTVVLSSGEEVAVPPDSALARSMGQVAGLLAHW